MNSSDNDDKDDDNRTNNQSNTSASKKKNLSTGNYEKDDAKEPEDRERRNDR